MAISTVWPSAGALATKPLPMVPPAPGRFSTSAGWLQASCSFCPMVRASVSVAPPAG